MKKFIIILSVLSVSCRKDINPELKNCTRIYSSDTIVVGVFQGQDLYNCGEMRVLNISYGGKTINGKDTTGYFFFMDVFSNVQCNLKLNKDTDVIAGDGIRFEVKFTKYFLAPITQLQDSGSTWVMETTLQDSAAQLFIRPL
jgi:hypothetical protein